MHPTLPVVLFTNSIKCVSLHQSTVLFVLNCRQDLYMKVYQQDFSSQHLKELLESKLKLYKTEFYKTTCKDEFSR
jgi:hypothetical protein